jgi:hypothetical protein
VPQCFCSQFVDLVTEKRARKYDRLTVAPQHRCSPYEDDDLRRGKNATPEQYRRSALMLPLAALSSWSLSYQDLAEVTSLQMRNLSHSQARLKCRGRNTGASMWIVWYAATIGSLSAFGSLSTLGLLPFQTPTKIERERQQDIDGM